MSISVEVQGPREAWRAKPLDEAVWQVWLIAGLLAAAGLWSLVTAYAVPAFGLSGAWRCAVLLASAAPFVWSLGWRNMRPAYNI